LNYWGLIPDHLKQHGCDIYTAHQEAFISIPDNALKLKFRILDILEKTKKDKINIIGHSKGGLEARYVASRLGMDEHISSITTLGSPHRGTHLADIILGRLPLPKFATARLVNLYATLMGDKRPDSLRAVVQVTTQGMNQFNEEVPDSSKVYYQSYASHVNKEVNLDTGRNAREVDEAKMAALLAFGGQYRVAQPIVEKLLPRRELFGDAEFVEWLGVATRALAMATGYEPRKADSLLRRAIRLKGADIDHWVRLRLLRVELLRSTAFNLPDRADWLLSHINQKILDRVGEKTLAAYLDEEATRLFAAGNFKGAFKRLRRLGGLKTTDERMGRAMLLMARCRRHFRDYEAATRYASTALHYGMRAASLPTVKGAADFLRDLEKEKPRRLPKLVPPARAKGLRPRLTAAADIPTPTSPGTAELFEVLQTRFRVELWVRRRGAVSEAYGEHEGDYTDSLSVYQQDADGGVSRLMTCGEPDSVRAIMLTRRDGSDLVVYRPESGAEAREDAIVQFLLTDQGAAQAGAGEGAMPSRKVMVDEYMRRALDQGITRGLHHTMETMFNKDVLIFFEEQGFSKEEMADKLGVSRATLYRMFARAGLN